MSNKLLQIENEQELESKVIDFLRLPLMIGVVIIHCRFTTILQPQLLDYVNVGGGGYFYVSWLISKVLCGLCVPTFFFISGYLFFKKGPFDFGSYIHKLKKRFFTILIPFISWNVIYILIFVFLGYNIRFCDDGTPMGIVPWLNGNTGSVISNLYHWVVGVFINFNSSGSPADVPFWYLRDLICMFILTPVIYLFVKCLKKYSLIITAFVWVLSGKYVTFPHLFLRPSILFFIMGSYFAINKVNIILVFNKIGKWIYWLYGIFAIMDLLTNQSTFNCYIHKITLAIGVVVVFKMAIHIVDRRKYPEKKLLLCVKNTNFFIFAFHWILLYWLVFPLSKIYNGTDLSLIVVYFLEIILCCSIAIAIGVLLNKLLPKTMRFLCGR